MCLLLHVCPLLVLQYTTRPPTPTPHFDAHNLVTQCFSVAPFHLLAIRPKDRPSGQSPQTRSVCVVCVVQFVSEGESSRGTIHMTFNRSRYLAEAFFFTFFITPPPPKNTHCMAHRFSLPYGCGCPASDHAIVAGPVLCARAIMLRTHDNVAVYKANGSSECWCTQPLTATEVCHPCSAWKCGLA